ncbi:MAG: 30S ribosomal protein S12 methylthiotransferase RimO [Planctomycetota bacterium]
MQTLAPQPSAKTDAPESDVRSVAFVSLGCPKNLVDSERMLGLLAEDGIAVTPDHNEADAIVINTCGFLEASKEESMAEINEAIARKEAGLCKRVVVAGCLVQRHKTKLLADAPGIDRLVGVFDRDHIVDAVRGQRPEVDHFLGRYHALTRNPHDQIPNPKWGEDGSKASALLAKQAEGKRGQRLAVFENDRGRLRLTPRHYAYLRMSEGCNQGCGFCTIPSIRGPMRSKPVEHIVTEAKELAADGAVELLLIGQDTTSYGTDIGYGPGLSGLLRQLDRELTDVAWVRLMYAYPSCFTDEMIDTLARCRRVLPYIDMPLQHINTDVLTRMKRKVSREETVELLDKLRERIPGIAIRTTFIAGSPGETEAEHQELVEFVRDFGFDMMGVFPYFPEPGTPMGRMTDQVDEDTKRARLEELMLAQQEVAFARAESLIGSTQEVLIDKCEGDVDEGGKLYTARTYRQAPDIDSVTYVHDPAGNLHPGQFVDVELTDYQNYDHVARVAVKKAKSLSVIS